jgi:hypothetical protein
LNFGVFAATENPRESLRAFLADRPMPPSRFASNGEVVDN